jgi:hypothetical protein
MGTRRARTPIGTVLAAVVIGLLATAATAAPAAAGTAAGTRWRLEDYHQTACFSVNVHDTYYGIYIQGHWSSAIDVGARGLPAGGSFDTSYAPIPPGSSTGEYTLAYVHVSLSVNPPIGQYQAWIWASDGQSRQRVPVTLDVKDRCGY